MSNLVDVNGSSFKKDVIDQSFSKFVVVDFWASWCGPCRMLGPILEKLASEMDFVLAKVNTDANQELARQYQISGIPSVKVFHEGKVVDEFVGVVPYAHLKKHFAQYMKANTTV
jgi:putative thioredoxin